MLSNSRYEVHGIKRRASSFNADRIDHLYQDPHVENQRFFLHYRDMTDSTNLIRLIQEIRPDDIVAGVQAAIAARVTAMAARQVTAPVVFTGGVAMVPGMDKALHASLGVAVAVAENQISFSFDAARLPWDGQSPIDFQFETQDGVSGGPSQGFIDTTEVKTYQQ